MTKGQGMQPGAERFLTHYVGGSWRIPLADDLVPTDDPLRVLVAAGPADLARARRLAEVAAPGWAALSPADRRAALPPALAEPVRLPDAPLAGLVLIAWDGDQTVQKVAATLQNGALVVLLTNLAEPMAAYDLVQACHDLRLADGVLSLLHVTDAEAAALALAARRY